MFDSILRLLPFAGRSKPDNDFVVQFRAIIGHALLACDELRGALRDGPDRLKGHLAAIEHIEHQADGAVGAIHRLVDKTFIPPYDKRDIITLTHKLDDIVDTMRTAVRRMGAYRATANVAPEWIAVALLMADAICSAVAELKAVTEAMPGFDHDAVRAAAKRVSGFEDQGDDLFTRAVALVFPNLDEPVTARMHAWREIFGLLEQAVDHCDHAMARIVSIARQEGH